MGTGEWARVFAILGELSCHIRDSGTFSPSGQDSLLLSTGDGDDEVSSIACRVAAGWLAGVSSDASRKESLMHGREGLRSACSV